MTKHRFFISSNVIKGGMALLSGREHHHLARVLRLRAGDVVFLFTDKEEEYLAEITEIGEKESLLHIKQKLEHKGTEALLEIALLQAIPRRGRMDVIVQKATELGVQKIIPLITERSVHPKNSENKQKRWQRISLEAAKQCGRRKAAQVYHPVFIKDINLKQLPKGKLILSEHEGRGLKDVLFSFSDKKIAIMVGAEGGWSEEEICWAVDKGFIPIKLGSRILRTETASLVALSIVQYQLGDIGF